MARDTLKAGYGMSQRIISGNIAGISNEESLKQPTQEGNCINWIAGHILATRGSVLELLGEESYLSKEEAAPYRRGAATIKPGDTCVGFERLREGLEQSGEIIVRRLTSADDGFLQEILDLSVTPFTVEIPTRDALLTLLLFHEGYHAGQLGLNRRLLGKEGAVK